MMDGKEHKGKKPQHIEEYMREEMMIRHYYMKKEAVPSSDQVRKELECFHRTHHLKQSNGISLVCSFLAGAAAVVICIFLFHKELFLTSGDEPVTVFLANEEVENVTLQRAGGEFVVIDRSADRELLNKLGVSLDATKEQLVYDKKAETDEVQMQILTTPRQRMFQVVLSDGTKVWLNAESQLSYPSKFIGEQRVVTLRGEAFFEVAKQENCPFVVQTENISTKVLGTEFNVRNYTLSDTHVTLLNGSVEVRNASMEQIALVRPGEDAHLTDTGTFEIKPVDTDTYCLWKDGAFYFDHVSLIEIAKELGRWYNVDVVFNNQKAMHVTMHFLADRNAPLQQAVNLLNSLNKAKVSFVHNQLVID